jgi:hypothetical protein
VSENLPKPAPLSEEKLFEARTSKVQFVNPPGYEHYRRCKGSDYDASMYGGWERKDREARWGTQDGNSGMAVQNRPLKNG